MMAVGRNGHDEKKENGAFAQQGKIRFGITLGAHGKNLAFLPIIGLDKWARFGFHLSG